MLLLTTSASVLLFIFAACSRRRSPGSFQRLLFKPISVIGRLESGHLVNPTRCPGYIHATRVFSTVYLTYRSVVSSCEVKL